MLIHGFRIVKNLFLMLSMALLCWSFLDFSGRGDSLIKEILKYKNKLLSSSDGLQSFDRTAILRDIALREYNFSSSDSSAKCFYAPNRANEFVSRISPDVWQLEPMSDSGDWELSIRTESIEVNGQPLAGMGAAPDSIRQLQSRLDIVRNGYTEVYENDTHGLRQSFVIQDPNLSDAHKEIAVYLSFSGVNGLTLSENKQVVKIESDKFDPLNYQGLKVWDAAGRVLTSRIELSGNTVVLLTRTDSATVFPITVDPIIANGTPSNANKFLESNQASSNMGTSVSSAGDLNGDGYSDLAVSVPSYTNNEINEGAIYVYHGSSTGISTTPQKIIESNRGSTKLGSSVTAADVNGDGYSDLVAGAPNYGNFQYNEGAVYIYHGSSTGVSSTPAVILESNQNYGCLGCSVACAGDVNGDGYSDIIAGAYTYSNGQSYEGGAFVYHGSSSGVSSTPALLLESNQSTANFGASVSGAGDLNGDGYSDVVVGANLYDNGQTDEGAAFIYHGSSSGVSSTPVIQLERNQAGAYMGFSVSFAGDVNGDGYSDVVVGANYYDNGQTDEGAAFIYQGSSSGVSSTPALLLESNQGSARFGGSVSGAGDVNGDGYGDLIVGAGYYSNGQASEGAAFVYQGSSTGVVGTAASMIESDQANAILGGFLFGEGVSSAGDLNGDGYSDIVIGCLLYDNGQTDEGASLVFHGSSNGVATTASKNLESDQASAYFGVSVSSAGDVNGDGYSDLIVGAPQYSNGQSNEGAIFIYYGSSAGLSGTPSVTVESNKASAFLGCSVAWAGDINGDGYGDVVAGSKGYSNGQTDEGAVLVFHGSSGGVSSTASIVLESNQANAQMGGSVAGAGDLNGDGYSDLVVGVLKYSNGQTAEGAAFVYKGSATGVSSTANMVLESNQSNAGMGSSVAAAGDVNGDGFGDLVVGAATYDNGQTDEGVVFVYHGSSWGISGIPAVTLEVNQANALLGGSVSSAGDVNADGYSDLLIGASAYDNGQTDEGAVFLYHGSSGGLSGTATTVLECNQAGAGFGTSLACVGDLNGDGYSDLAVGATSYSNGQSNEGAGFVYYGSSSGISNTASATLEVDQASANLGSSLSAAGDINGDGYSDLAIGAYLYDNGQTDEGAAFIYQGNNGGSSNRNQLRLFNTGTVTPLGVYNNYYDTKFAIGLYARSYLGRSKAKIIWETRGNGKEYSHNSPITNSTAFTGSATTYTNLGVNGVLLSTDISKLTASISTKVRARIAYSLTTAIDGQIYGPWRYFVQGEISGGMLLALPVGFVSESATMASQGHLRTQWSYPNNKEVSYYGIEVISDGKWLQIDTIQATHPDGVYVKDHELRVTNQLMVRIVAHTLENCLVKSTIMVIDSPITMEMYPNPATSKVYLSGLTSDGEQIQVIDATGSSVLSDVVITREGYQIELDISSLKSGLYYVLSGNKIQRLIKI